VIIFSLLLTGCVQKSDDFLKSGLSKEKNKKYKEALTDFNKAIELDSSNARAYLGRALVVCNAGFIESREADLSKYIELTEHDLATAYIGRALSKRLQQDFHASFVDLDKAICIYPADIQSFTLKEEFLIESRDSVRLKKFRESLDEQTLVRMKNYKQQYSPSGYRLK
jgi:tetratricopeptide (TPR) repeat protein